MKFNLKLSRLDEYERSVELDARDLEQAFERASLIQKQLNDGESVYQGGDWISTRQTFIARDVTEA